jgi:hypothetical protein
LRRGGGILGGLNVCLYVEPFRSGGGSRIGKGKEKQKGHIDRYIDISIPRLFMGTAIAVGALQYTMVAWLGRQSL